MAHMERDYMSQPTLTQEEISNLLSGISTSFDCLTLFPWKFVQYITEQLNIITPNTELQNCTTAVARISEKIQAANNMLTLTEQLMLNVVVEQRYERILMEGSAALKSATVQDGIPPKLEQWCNEVHQAFVEMGEQANIPLAEVASLSGFGTNAYGKQSIMQQLPQIQTHL